MIGLSWRKKSRMEEWENKSILLASIPNAKAYELSTGATAYAEILLLKIK